MSRRPRPPEKRRRALLIRCSYVWIAPPSPPALVHDACHRAAARAADATRPSRFRWRVGDCLHVGRGGVGRHRRRRRRRVFADRALRLVPIAGRAGTRVHGARCPGARGAIACGGIAVVSGMSSRNGVCASPLTRSSCNHRLKARPPRALRAEARTLALDLMQVRRLSRAAAGARVVSHPQGI